MTARPAHSPPHIPPAPRRIPHREDTPVGRERVRQALSPEAISGELVYATTEAEFTAARDRDAIDLIRSDFTPPGYDGLSALALARKKCPAGPPRFLSGALGEEQAVEGLRRGAADLVRQGRRERLRHEGLTSGYANESIDRKFHPPVGSILSSSPPPPGFRADRARGAR